MLGLRMREKLGEHVLLLPMRLCALLLIMYLLVVELVKRVCMLRGWVGVTESWRDGGTELTLSRGRHTAGNVPDKCLLLQLRLLLFLWWLVGAGLHQMNEHTNKVRGGRQRARTPPALLSKASYVTREHTAL
jgi:hypothetical protein